MNRRVLVTGASGNLGRKAISALLELDDVSVVALDQLAAIESDRAVDFRRADLSVYDESWSGAFSDVDVVLHLAADPRPVASWESVLRSNIDLSLNVLRAAEEHEVGRFVFASSNWVHGGYRFTRQRLVPSTPPRPVNPYGASKLLIERAAAAVSNRCGMSVLALRLGWCQPGDNVPGPHMAFGRWGQELWLSNDDWRQVVRLACTATVDGFVIVNVMSDVAGMRWDLSETESILGYRPTSHHVPRLSVRGRATDGVARLRDSLLRPVAEAARIGARW